MSVIQTKPLTTRDPGPYPADRRCVNARCRAFLRTTNPGPFCDPCSPSIEKVSDRAVLEDRAELLEELMVA